MCFFLFDTLAWFFKLYLKYFTDTLQLRSKMTEGEQSVAMEIFQLLEDRARMNEQGVNTLMITQQIKHICKN